MNRSRELLRALGLIPPRQPYDGGPNKEENMRKAEEKRERRRLRNLRVMKPAA